MRHLDLEIAINNDPTFDFFIRDYRHDPINISGATIECYVKNRTVDPDSEAIVYIGMPLLPASQGRCRVEMSAADVGGKEEQVYHLDLIKDDRRTTHYYGSLKKKVV